MMEQNRTMNMGMNQNMNRNMNQGMNQTCQQLWQTINEAGFAMDDINLYLDTHPCDQEALKLLSLCHRIVSRSNGSI